VRGVWEGVGVRRGSGPQGLSLCSAGLRETGELGTSAASPCTQTGNT